MNDITVTIRVTTPFAGIGTLMRKGVALWQVIEAFPQLGETFADSHFSEVTFSWDNGWKIEVTREAKHEPGLSLGDRG